MFIGGTGRRSTTREERSHQACGGVRLKSGVAPATRGVAGDHIELFLSEDVSLVAGTTVDELRVANQLDRRGHIYAGQRLRLPM